MEKTSALDSPLVFQNGAKLERGMNLNPDIAKNIQTQVDQLLNLPSESSSFDSIKEDILPLELEGNIFYLPAQYLNHQALILGLKKQLKAFKNLNYIQSMLNSTTGIKEFIVIGSAELKKQKEMFAILFEYAKDWDLLRQQQFQVGILQVRTSMSVEAIQTMLKNGNDNFFVKLGRQKYLEEKYFFDSLIRYELLALKEELMQNLSLKMVSHEKNTIWDEDSSSVDSQAAEV
ncbi:MAG TPA: hypothetical protein PLQ36_01195 [Candidatus Gracilibacteria bacterium]|nr:hypothetical protein [Candidatus Gracilibacteria bacterium]